MKALLLRCLVAAILIGPAIGFVSELVAFRRATKYDPPLTEAEFSQMGNMTVREMEATLSKRTKKVGRWEWLSDSIHYSYFWKNIARRGVIPGSGVFLACAWIGFIEKRGLQKAAPLVS